MYHFLPFLLCPFHIIVAHRKWTVTFLFYSITKNDCTSATIEAQRQLCWYKTGNCISPFFYTNGWRAANVYLSLTLVKGLLLFTDSYINTVQHHFTDEVSHPASLFSPCLCFSFFREKKNHNYPQSPGVYSCRRLDCAATNQPLSGEHGALKATASGGSADTWSLVTSVKVAIIHVCGCSTGMWWEAKNTLVTWNHPGA